MCFKKNVLSEQLLSRGNVFSRVGWAVVACLIVLTGLLLNSSLKGSAGGSLFQGVYSVSDGTVSRHSSPPSSSASGSAGNASGAVQLQSFPGIVEGNGEVNVSEAVKKQDFMEDNGGGVVLEDVHLGNFSDGVKNGSFGVDEGGGGGGGGIEQMSNGSNVGLDSLITDEEILAEIQLGNFTEVVDDGSLMGENKNATEASEGKSEENPRNVVTRITENKEAGKLQNNADGGFPGAEEKAAEVNKQGNAVDENKTPNTDGDPQVGKVSKGSYEDCDFFDGKWVRDDSDPYYPPGSCPYVDKDFDCQRNGRPDDGYIKWKWQPNGCDVARLNATDFLERLRGRRLVFVGDSLNRNMWESLVCILRHSVADKNRVYEISGRSDFKKKGIYAFRFEDYNCSVDFVAAPFLVKESTFQRENETIETLRLDLMDPSTSMYHDAEVMVFNTGHWWTHEKTSKGEDYYQEGDYVYPRLKVLKAFQKALRTWARWVDQNINSTQTQVLYRGYSVTHFQGGQWNSGGKCHEETEPITDENHLTKYPSKMRALENVIRKANTPIMYLNVSRLTDYRKDAHPAIYRRQYKTPEESIAAVRSQDCSHWCLPGVPDTWNELLYASLLKAGMGVWGNQA
ncbi:hypothetical protein SLE2022_377800 [Rubroshorea leprosula]